MDQNNVAHLIRWDCAACIEKENSVSARDVYSVWIMYFYYCILKIISKYNNIYG